LTALSKIVGKSNLWCENRIPKILEDNQDKEWKKKYLDKSYRLLVHYSPELISLLKEESNKYEKPPVGWLPLASLADLVGRSAPWCSSRIKKFCSLIVVLEKNVLIL
jgi:DNA-binding Lrp family transcriptional regulator